MPMLYILFLALLSLSLPAQAQETEAAPPEVATDSVDQSPTSEFAEPLLAMDPAPDHIIWPCRSQKPIPKGCTQIPLQGECGPLRIAQGFDIQSTVASASCPGITPAPSMMNLTYSNGHEYCLFVDNFSNRLASGPKNYFLPLKTESELKSFLSANIAGSNRSQQLSKAPLMTTFGCKKGTVTAACKARPDDNVNFTIEQNGRDLDIVIPDTVTVNGYIYEARFTCNAFNSCGQWSAKAEDVKCTPVKTISAVTLAEKKCEKDEKPVHADVAMLIDASSSMDEELATAKNDLKRLINTIITPKQDIRISLLRFGGLKTSDSRTLTTEQYCKNIQNIFPLGRLSGDAAFTAVASVKAEGLTPLAASFSNAAQTFTDKSRQRFILMLSDGQETCDQNVTSAVGAVKAQGIKLLGIRYKTSENDRIGDAFGKQTFANFDQYRDVVISNGSQEESDALYKALTELFEHIIRPACAISANIYKKGTTDLVAFLKGDEKANLEHGMYDVVYDLCGQTQKDSIEVKEDLGISSTLSCPAN